MCQTLNRVRPVYSRLDPIALAAFVTSTWPVTDSVRCVFVHCGENDLYRVEDAELDVQEDPELVGKSVAELDEILAGRIQRIVDNPGIPDSTTKIFRKEGSPGKPIRKNRQRPSHKSSAPA